jgi:DNA transformation protein and related proteins
MPRRSETVEYLVELMRPWGAVTAKSMFGGWGLYREGLFFALVADDVLYLKTDDETRAAFEAQQLEPFVFRTRDGTGTAMSYRRAPDEALENPEEMARWARLAYEAALRAAARKSPARRPTKPK